MPLLRTGSRERGLGRDFVSRARGWKPCLSLTLWFPPFPKNVKDRASGILVGEERSKPTGRLGHPPTRPDGYSPGPLLIHAEGLKTFQLSSSRILYTGSRSPLRSSAE